MSTIEFPDKINVKRLPFMLQGWNTVYYKTDEIRDDCPVYRLEPYTLYWVFPIIGVTIYRRKGRWVMQRDCDFDSYIGIQKTGLSLPQADPCGSWSYGAVVTPVTQTNWWFSK